MSHTRIPVDLILHATAEALHSLAMASARDACPDNAAEFSATHHAILRAIRPDALAEEWNASGPTAQMGAWIARVTTGDIPRNELGLTGDSTAETRAIEIAVARRLADTACSLRITGDAEDTAHAETLWRAAGAIVGMQVEAIAAPSGFKVPTMVEVVKGYRDTIRNARQILGMERVGGGDFLFNLISLREALGASEGDDLVAVARLIKARAVENEKMLQRSAALEATMNDIAEVLGVHEFSIVAVVRSLDAEVKSLRDTAARRLATITEHDKTDADIREALGANDGETTTDAAKRAAKARDDHYDNALRLIGELNSARKDIDGKVAAADARALGAHQKTERADRVCGHLRKERDAAIAGRDDALRLRENDRREAAMKYEKVTQAYDMACKGRNLAIAERDALKGRDPCETCRHGRQCAIAERDAAIASAHVAVEARAQMQAKLIEARSLCDAAEEEAKALRASLASRHSSFVPFIVEWTQTE